MSDAPESTIKLAEAVRASIADPAGCLKARWFENPPKDYRNVAVTKQHAREIIGYAIEEALNLVPEPWGPAPGDVVRLSWDKRERWFVIGRDHVEPERWIVQALDDGRVVSSLASSLKPVTEESEDNC